MKIKEDKRETRNMKVYNQSSYRYKSTPTITLKGQWLRECGFEAGTPIIVQCEGASDYYKKRRICDGHF